MDDPGIRSTGWIVIPPEFTGGTIALQISNTTVEGALLELAHRPQIGPADPVLSHLVQAYDWVDVLRTEVESAQERDIIAQGQANHIFKRTDTILSRIKNAFDNRTSPRTADEKILTSIEGALRSTTQLNDWVDRQEHVGKLNDDVVNNLQSPINDAHVALSSSLSQLLNIEMDVDVYGDEITTGQTNQVKVTLANNSDFQMRDADMSLNVPDSWTVTEGTTTVGRISSGGQFVAEFDVMVPLETPVSKYENSGIAGNIVGDDRIDLGSNVSYSLRGAPVQQKSATQVSTESLVDIVSTSVEPDPVEAGNTATLRVVLQNGYNEQVSGKITAEGPENWDWEVSSRPFNLGANEERSLLFDVAVPRSSGTDAILTATATLTGGQLIDTSRASVEVNQPVVSSWEFEETKGGWYGSSNAETTLSDGSLIVDPTGENPRIQINDIQLDISDPRRIELTMTSSAPEGGRGKFFWRVPEMDSFWSSSRGESYYLGESGAENTYEVTIPGENTTVTNIRLDLLRDSGGSVGETFEIESIRIY
ncbi:hypothetical protein C5C07_17525 [Haloferax sp. Atlit-4N]|nr:hypothetical protein C5C07_17525 [Haloferax sp. Atlit-4N]